ncbi:hypothetical protein JTS97_03205 [Clostridium botulinum]|nr:hypothetical protein [Clostridium botulinum]
MDNKPKIINLDFYDNSMLNNVMTINMKEGRKPKAADEIILEKEQNKIWKKVGDYIEANNIDPEVLVKSLKVDSKITEQSNLQKLQSNEVKSYKIVGYYEKGLSQTSDLYEARGYLDKNSMKKMIIILFMQILKRRKIK